MTAPSRSRFSLLTLILYGLVVALCVLAVYGLRSRSSGPVTLGPSARTIRLENGMTLLFKQVPGAKVTSVRVLVRAGSVYEGRYLGYGISHLVEHLLFKGTDRFGMADMSQAIRELGGQHNAYTSFETMGFFITAPSTNAAAAASILANAVFHPMFDPGEVVKEKDVVLNEIAMDNDDIDRWMNQQLFAACYDRHPYRWPVAGLAERFRTITRADVAAYYASRYRPENIVFSVAGDFDPNAVTAAIRSEADRAVFHPAEPALVEPEPAQSGYRFRQLTRPDATLSRLVFAWRSVGIRSPDLYALDVLSMMLGAGKPSVLNKDLKEKRGLVQDVSCFSYTPLDPGLFGFEATLEDRNMAQVTNLLFRIASSVPRLLTKKNLDRAKNLVLSGRVTSLQTVDGLASLMASDELLTGDPDFSSAYIDRVKSLTLEDLRKVAEKYLHRESLTVVLLRPESAVPRAAVSSNKAPPAVRMEKTVLRSGLRILYIYRTNLPLLNLKFLVRGGTLLDEGHPGIDRFVNQALVKGNRRYPGLSAYEAIESVGGSLDNYSGNNSAGVTVQVLDKDAGLGLNVLFNEVSSATFKRRDVEAVRSDLVNTVEQQSEEIFQTGMNRLRALMYPGHPYRYPADGTVPSLRSIAPRDLKNFYRQHYSCAGGILVVTGRVTPALKRKVASAFGRLRKGSAPPVSLVRPAGSVPGPVSFQTNFGKQRSLVLIGFPMPSVTNASRYDLEVLQGALSGLGSRLFVRLRDVQHLGYQVGASPAFMLDPGCFFFYVTTARPDEAEASLLREIRNLRSEPFTEKEITMARNDLLGDYLSAEQAWDSLAANAGLFELYYGDYRKYFEYPAALSAVDPARLASEAERLFRGQGRTVILRGAPR